MKTANLILIFILLASCSLPKSDLSKNLNCNTPGTVHDGIIEEMSRGYPYTYKIYLPPCYESNAGPEYPVIFMIPGMGGGKSVWLNVKVNEKCTDYCNSTYKKR